MKLSNLFNENGVSKSLETLCPSVFHTTHVKRELNQSNTSIIILKTIAQVFYLFIQKKKTIDVHSNQVLFYSPNSKYEKFSSILEEEFIGKCDVLTEKNYSSKTFDSQDLTSVTTSRFAVFKLLYGILQLRKIAKKRSELPQFKENYWLIFSLLRKDLFLSSLFKRKKYHHFFSFHPVGDLHMLINNLHGDKFSCKYAIRPTTTYFNKENEFIKTEFLYYKTEREKEIYKKNISSHIKLLPAGLIIAESKKQVKGTAILFVDTCTNAYLNSPIIRKKAIVDFLDFAKHTNSNIFFKFHPGLLPKFKAETVNLISQYNLPKLKIVDQIPFEEIKICLSFDSTVMFECIVKGIIITNLHGEYDMYPSVNPEFSDASIPVIRNKNEFQQLHTFLVDESSPENIGNLQKDWLESFYNFPVGMKTIISKLSEK